MNRRTTIAGIVALVCTPLALTMRGEVGNYGGWLAAPLSTLIFLAFPQRWHKWVGLLHASISTVAMTIGWQTNPAAAGLMAVAMTGLGYWTWRFLTEGGRHPAVAPISDDQHERFATSTGIYAAVMAVPSAGAAWYFGDNIALGVATTFFGINGMLVALLPLLMEHDPLRPVAGWHERAWMQAMTLTIVVIAMLPGAPMAVLFAIFPLQVWMANRASRFEAEIHVAALSLLLYFATMFGYGPFHDNGAPNSLNPFLLGIFIVSLAYLNLPGVVAVAQKAATAQRANRRALTIQRLINSATGTVFIATDADGAITHFNGGAQTLLGYDVDEVIGRDPGIFCTREELDRQGEHFGVGAGQEWPVIAKAALDSRRDWHFLRGDGVGRVLSCTVTEVVDDDAGLVGYICAGEDVTERIRAERVLQATLVREHEAVANLKQTDQMKQELVSNVSHELRTPITSINGYAEMLADGGFGELSAEQIDVIERIAKSSRRLTLLVDDLLTLAKAESSSLDLQFEPIDLRDVVADAVDMVGSLGAANGITIVSELPDAPVNIVGDAPHLERVVLNLLSNAIKYSPSDQQATVTIEQQPDTVTLSVTDQGIGMSESDVKRLFTRFFRATTATEKAIPGNGLGLSIVDAIVRGHNGSIDVRSRIGRGTTFTVWLPRDASREDDKPAA